MRRRHEPTMEERFLRGQGAVEPPPRRGVPPAVRTVVAGLGRLAFFIALAAAIGAGAGLLVGFLRDADPGRSASLGMYLGGAALVAVAVLSSGGRSYSAGEYEIIELEVDSAGRRAWQNQLAVYLTIGVAVIGLGVLLEILAG